MVQNSEKNNLDSDRRRYPRIPIEIKFFCKSPAPSQEDGLLHFYSRDLSCGGVFLKGKAILNPGNVVHLDFKLPEHDQTISVSGVVIRATDDGMGVRFLTLNINEFEMVEDFVNDML